MYDEYKGLNVAVLGFGRSGRAATDFLLAAGARVRVYAACIPQKSREDYRLRDVRFAESDFPPQFSEGLLVRSPVIRPDIPPICRSLAAGAVLTSEIELLLRHTPARVIGVTGSDGKTTTANLIARLLRQAGHRVYLGGNNGTPLLPQVKNMRAGDFAVLELSSFQLMTLSQAPARSVITNITPNHLDWHRDMAEYAGAKCRICGKQTERLLFNGEDPYLRAIGADSDAPITYFSLDGEDVLLRDRTSRTYPVPDTLRLPGRHNRLNLAAAWGAVEDLVTPAHVRAALADFYGVPHRLQYVDTVNGVRFYNSSIDTSPTRTAAALQALQTKPIVIAGGRGKGVSFTPLGDILAERATAVCLYGEAAEEIERAVAGRIPTHRFRPFAAAFHAAAELSREGDTVLLSPGCTAFDQFRDFEHRGDTFCALVEEWKGKTND